MSLSEFWEVIRDCELSKKTSDTEPIKKEIFNRIFDRADALEEDSEGGGSAASGGDAEITPDGFVNALIEISLRKYKKEKSWSKRFDLLLTKKIFSFFGKLFMHQSISSLKTKILEFLFNKEKTFS